MTSRKHSAPATARSPSPSPAAQRAVLDRLSDALALVECAEHALDAAEAPGAELTTLRAGIAALRGLHAELDAVVALGADRLGEEDEHAEHGAPHDLPASDHDGGVR